MCIRDRNTVHPIITTTTCEVYMQRPALLQRIILQQSPLIACSDCRHRQDKTVLSCLDPVSNLQPFSLKYTEDCRKLGNWKLGLDKTRQFCLVCSCVHTADTDKTCFVLSCRRCEQAIRDLWRYVRPDLQPAGKVHVTTMKKDLYRLFKCPYTGPEQAREL